MHPHETTPSVSTLSYLSGKYGGDTQGTFKADPKELLVSENGRVIGIHDNSGLRNRKRLDTG